MADAAPQKAKKTKKGRKYGRNSKSGQNAAYICEQRSDKSHLARINKHLARYGERKKPQVDHPKRKRSLQANSDQVALQARKNYLSRLGVSI